MMNTKVSGHVYELYAAVVTVTKPECGRARIGNFDQNKVEMLNIVHSSTSQKPPN